MATLTAGQSSSFKGFAAAGNAIGLPTFGSFDTAPFAGVTTQYIYTTDGTSGSIGLTGNQSPSFFGGQIYVDGVAWAVAYTAYDGTHTSYSLTPANGTGFVNATNYNVSLTSAPVDPNITSAAAVTNLVNTTLAHTITADKTIASTAIIGGADAAAFEINGTNQLRFASNAASSALGPLVVQIQITDNDGLTDTQTITVTVKAIVFKASKFYSRAGATSTAPVILTDFSNPLTGANSIAAAIGDTIVAFPAIGSNADRDMIVNSGYAEHADHYVNGTTYDANIGLFTKTLTSTETSLTIGSSGSANDAQAMILMLFQGVDATTPMDVSVVLDQGTGTGKPNPAAITPATPGAIAIFGGAQAAATAVALTSSDLTAFTQRVQADTNDIGVGAGFIEWSGSGAIDPAVFGGGSSNAANSWATISAVLRPAWTGGGLNGTAAITEAADTAAATAAITLTGAASPTEAADTLAAPAALSISGSLSATEASDTIVAAGEGLPAISGSLNATEGGDTLGATATVPIAGLLSVAEASDIVSGASTIDLSGTAAITDAGDTIASTGAALVKGVASIVESGDAISATSALLVAGTSTLTEGADTVAASSAALMQAVATLAEADDLANGAAALFVTGALALNEGDDTLAAFSGSSRTGDLAITEADDGLAATGLHIITGTASLAEADDALSASAALPITGALSQTEANDTLASLGALALRATASLTEGDDTLATSNGRAGSASIAEAGDTVAAIGTLIIRAVGAIVEEMDALSSASVARISGVAAIAEQDDVVSSSSGVAMQGAGAVTEADDAVEATATKRVIMAPSEARNIATALASRTANSNEPARDVSTAPTPRDQVTAVGSRDARSVRLAR